MKLKLTLAALFALAPFVAAAQGPAPTPAPTTPPAVQEGKQAPATPAAGKALTTDDVNAWLDGYMPYALATGDLAGAVVAVVKDGQPLTMRGFGYSDLKTQKTVDPELTLFRPGSVSKLFTWTAVMQQVQAGKLDLVITDLNMPVMNGLELIRALRKLPSAVGMPIVFLTTESNDTVKQEAKSAGATGWITKPFKPEQLLAVVAKLVRT